MSKWGKPAVEEKPKGPECVNVLCDGKSFAKFDAERDLLDGPVVCVNTARASHVGDVWLIHSHVGELGRKLREYGFTSLLPLMGEASQELWTGACFTWGADDTDAQVRKDLVAAAAQHVEVARSPEMFSRLLGWTPQESWFVSAPLCAVAVAISRGAKRIRVIGADMKGTGYGGLSGEPFGWVESETPEARRKWARSRVLVKQAIAECKEHGIALEFVSPPVAKAEPVKDDVPTTPPKDLKYTPPPANTKGIKGAAVT